MISAPSCPGLLFLFTAQVGSDVYAGTTNLTGMIDIQVTTIGQDTTIGKVTQPWRAFHSAMRGGRSSR